MSRVLSHDKIVPLPTKKHFSDVLMADDLCRSDQAPKLTKLAFSRFFLEHLYLLASAFFSSNRTPGSSQPIEYAVCRLCQSVLVQIYPHSDSPDRRMSTNVKEAVSTLSSVYEYTINR